MLGVGRRESELEAEMRVVPGSVQRWMHRALLPTLLIGLALLTSVAAAQEAYSIRPGDVLRIEVIEDPSINRSVLVSPDGRINVPLAGAVVASGRSVEQVQADLAAGLASNFAAPPNVFVAVERLAERTPTAPSAPRAPAPPPTMDIYVIGEVGNPGKLSVPPGTTVLQLFAEMGGFTRFAATRRIQLRRTATNGTETIYNLNYEAMMDGRSPNGTAVLIDGDVIVVPERRLFE